MSRALAITLVIAAAMTRVASAQKATEWDTPAQMDATAPSPAHGLWPTVRHECSRIFEQASHVKGCVEALFTDPPAHVTGGFAVVPMSGAYTGLGGSPDLSSGAMTIQMPFAALWTWNRFWFLSDTAKWRPYSHRGLSEHENYEAYGLARDLHSLTDYGEGPTSPRIAMGFGGREQVVGASARVPWYELLDLGFGAEFRHWRTTAGVRFPSIQTSLADGDAPGMSRPASYVHMKAVATLHDAKPKFYRDSLEISYEPYLNVGGGHYSFGEIEANMAAGLSSYRQGLRVRARLVLTKSFAGDTVPFYYQPTLGQSDIDGREDLRGYDNYRFRGLHSALIQADYAVAVLPRHDWLRVLAFGDAGKVAMRLRDLDARDIRGDYGAGLSLYFATVPRASVYLAHSPERKAILGGALSISY